MADLKIILSGQEVGNAAETLSRLLAEGETGAVVSRIESSALPEVTRRIIDPISVGALILVIPSAILAVIDITDRIRKRRKAQSLIDAAKKVKDESDVQTLIVLIDGSTRALDQLTADGLLELGDQLNKAI
jgi:hypothetical protein